MSIPNTPQNEAPQKPETIVVDAPAAAPAAPATPAAAPAAPAYTATSPDAAPAADTNDSNTLSITSFVLGLCSIVLGWTFIAPIAGLIIGILARKREPKARTFANWGIGLNAAMLALTLLMIILFIVAAAFFLPFLIVGAESGYYID